MVSPAPTPIAARQKPEMPTVPERLLKDRWLRGEVLTLPSGLQVVVRPTSIADCTLNGINVHGLTNYVVSIIGERGVVQTNEQAEQIIANLRTQADDMQRSLNAVMRLACFWPKVVMDYREVDGDDTAHISSFNTLDKMAVLSWVLGGEAADAAAAFREGEGAAADAVPGAPSGEGLRPAAEQLALAEGSATLPGAV